MKHLSIICFFLLSTLLIVLGGCKKNSSPISESNVKMETGIFVGTLNNSQTGQNITKFQISITKTGDNTYEISQVGSGGVPTFTMLDKNHNNPFINFAIASQTFEGTNFSGSGHVAGGFDALYNTNTKSFYFGIAISNNSTKPILFNGYKE